MKEIDLTIPTGAIFSDDGRHRYALWRVWSQIRPILMLNGLNPSTANGILNDPTITRMMTRAYREGFGGLLAGNLSSYITSNPALLNWNDHIRPETDEYLRQMIAIADRHLVSWGSFPVSSERVKAVLAMIPEPYCLGVNANGSPKHPLYISYDVKMERYQI